MNKDQFLLFLIPTVIFGGWALFTEWRLYKLRVRLLSSEMREVDAKIKSDVHALSDTDLNNKLKADLRGT